MKQKLFRFVSIIVRFLGAGLEGALSLTIADTLIAGQVEATENNTQSGGQLNINAAITIGKDSDVEPLKKIDVSFTPEAALQITWGLFYWHSFPLQLVWSLLPATEPWEFSRKGFKVKHMSVLFLGKVSYHYSRTTQQVLKNFAAVFEPGSCTPLWENPALARVPCCPWSPDLTYPTAGTVYHQGHDILQFDRDEYRAKNIGIIFQGYNLLTNVTVLENIVLSMSIAATKTVI